MISRIAGNQPPPTPPKRLAPTHLSPGSSAAKVHFLVHPEMPEVVAYAQENGWFARGFKVLSVPWVEMRYTTDGWVNSHTLKSTDVPCPIINGWYYLPHVRSGQEVEFAVQAGIGCRAPEDRAGLREQAVLWFNNGGGNYRQVAS